MSGAKTPGIAYAAIEVNASGAWFENTLVDGADAAGVRLYFVDSTTNFRNITIKDSGDTNGGLHRRRLLLGHRISLPVSMIYIS